MKENKLYLKLRPHLLAWGECDRVENTLGPGMSDVFYNIGGKTGWLETKVAKGTKILFERFQPNWMAKHHRLGARIFVIVMDQKETIHVYRAGAVLKAPRTSYEKWISVDMSSLSPSFSMPAPYRSWGSIREILIS